MRKTAMLIQQIASAIAVVGVVAMAPIAIAYGGCRNRPKAIWLANSLCVGET